MKPTPRQGIEVSGHNKEPEVQNTSLEAANNDFGLRLFACIHRQDPNANAFVSPLSLAQALQMTLNGAAGDTRREMEQTLGLVGVIREQLNEQNARLQALLNEPDVGVTLAVANSLWTRDGALRPDFVQRVQTAYRATLGDLNSGAEAINRWVDAQTRHKIPQIVTPRDVANALALLVNAVYFKGTWAEKFNLFETQEEPFTTGAGDTKTVLMMRRTDAYAYFGTSQFVAVTLPYQSGHYALTCVLPAWRTSLEAAAQGLTSSVLTQAANARPEYIELSLPRFTLHGEYSLAGTLADMGMERAFKEGADFSEMSPDVNFVQSVLHKTFVSVDEEGTEAAAATVVECTFSSYLTTEVVFNRPFLVVLRDTRAGLILFLGAVNNP